MKHVPNALTGLRFLLIVVFVYLFWVPKNYLWALIVFAIAAFTDLLDGYIARKYNVITDTGKLLDPLADKLMLIAALSCLCMASMLPMFFLIFVIVKEFVMILGGIYLYKKNVVVYSRFIGKAATACFNAGIILTLLRPYYMRLLALPINEVLLYFAVGLAVVAFVQYSIKSFMKPVKEMRREKKQSKEEINE